MIDDNMFQMRTPPADEPQQPEVIIEEACEPFSFTRVLTFPFSGPGLSVITIYTLVPFLWVLLLFVTPLFIRNAMFFFGLLVKALIALSAIWYLAICIRAGAEGQTKAPAVFEFSQDDSFWDWLRQFLLILITVALCFFPAVVLKRCGLISEPVFWMIQGIGLFFLPMLLLAVVMFDTINALNPILITASIFSTFLSYCVIVLLFCVPMILYSMLSAIGSKSLNLFFLLFIRAANLYLLMIVACLLGRFFYRNEEKLRWDV